jgi:hypothetical protein
VTCSVEGEKVSTHREPNLHTTTDNPGGLSRDWLVREKRLSINR